VNKKNQISIFIIIAIVIIFLLMFMISSNFDDKKDEINKDKTLINSNGGEDLIFIKTMVDGCLEKQLRKATITAGLRGGFIFDKGEYYYPGSIPDNTYTPKLISNLDLNWNNLESKTLVHSQAQVYTPGLNSNNSFFSHSIKEDFEQFISIEFMNCLEFDEYGDIYLINYTDYLGTVEIIDFSSNKARISGLDADMDDKIKINFIDEDLVGKIINIDEGRFIVQFNNLNYLKNLDADFLKNLSVTNLDKNLNLNITFNDEDIRASIKYPVTIVNKEFTSLYENSEIILDVRFKKLIEFSSSILYYKSLENRSVNYLGPNNLIKALNSSDYGSDYFKKRGMFGIDFRMRIINETLSEKKYLYSIIDKESKILGNPYVFNFGYENIAPIVNFTAIDSRFDYDTKNNVITLIATKNQPINYKLEPYTTEYQYYDHYIKYFEEEEYDGPDAYFKLDKDGNLSFTAYREKVYTYNLIVTDTEAQREHTLVFITGFPDNTNNKAAKECFSFENYQDPLLFPIVGSFNDKIFDKVDADSGMHEPFAYSLYFDDEDVLESSKLYFKPSCTFLSDAFSVNAILTYGETTTTQVISFSGDDTNFIEIPQFSGPIKVEVEIKQGSNSLVETPFSMTIYPANCLGPEPQVIPGKSWDNTCCDLGKVSEISPESYVGTNTNLFNIENNPHDAINDDFVFLWDVESSSNFDYENKVIWDILGNDATSTYKGRIQAKCKGVYPTTGKNIEDIVPVGSGTSKSFGMVKGVDGGARHGIEIPIDPISVTLGKDIDAEMCEFGYGSNLSIRFFLNNGVVLSAGLVSDNTGSGSYGVSFIPDESEYDDLFILCDNNLLGSVDGGVSWAESLGSGTRNKIYKSRGYCAQDSNACSYRIINPVIDNKRDDTSSSKCIDYSFLNDNFNSQINPAFCNTVANPVCNAAGNCVGPAKCCSAPNVPAGCVAPPASCTP